MTGNIYAIITKGRKNMAKVGYYLAKVKSGYSQSC